MSDRKTDTTMSGPVDAPTLRSAGRRADYYQTGDGPLWRAAADEVDRLRAELAISENRAGGYEEVVAGLRAVIENAPHAPGCVHYAATWQTIGEPCTCWKATAL